MTPLTYHMMRGNSQQSSCSITWPAGKKITWAHAGKWHNQPGNEMFWQRLEFKLCRKCWNQSGFKRALKPKSYKQLVVTESQVSLQSTFYRRKLSRGCPMIRCNRLHRLWSCLNVLSKRQWPPDEISTLRVKLWEILVETDLVFELLLLLSGWAFYF